MMGIATLVLLTDLACLLPADSRCTAGKDLFHILSRKMSQANGQMLFRKLHPPAVSLPISLPGSDSSSFPMALHHGMSTRNQHRFQLPMRKIVPFLSLDRTKAGGASTKAAVMVCLTISVPRVTYCFQEATTMNPFINSSVRRHQKHTERFNNLIMLDLQVWNAIRDS